MTDCKSASRISEPGAEGPGAEGLSLVGQSSLWWMHGFFLCLALATMLMSFLMHSEGPTSVYLPGWQRPLPDACTLKRIIGGPCPGCGLTRSMISISHGQFQRAWHFNRAGFLVYALVLAQIPWHALQLFMLRRQGARLSWPLVYYFPIGVLVLLLLNGLARLLSW